MAKMVLPLGDLGILVDEDDLPNDGFWRTNGE